MSTSKDWQLLTAGLIGAVLGASLLATGFFLAQPPSTSPHDQHTHHAQHERPAQFPDKATVESTQAVTEALLRKLLNESGGAPSLPPETSSGAVATEPEPEVPDVSPPTIQAPDTKGVPIETPKPTAKSPPLVVLPPATGTGKKLVVVTTTTDTKSLVEAIGRERVEVASLATGYEDPHFIEAKPSYMMMARKTDLWIRIGMNLEIGYERLIIDGSRNSKIRVGSRGHLDASERVLRLEVPTTKVDRSMGDVHPMGNPHYLLDPLNARIVAGTIERRMSELSPGDAKYFAYNLEQFRKQLDNAMFGKPLVEKVGGGRLWALVLNGSLDAELKANNLDGQMAGWLAIMKPYIGKRIVTYHHSRSYFMHRFGLVVADQLEPKPGIPPGPRHIAEVIDRMKAEGIKVILIEPFHSRQAPAMVAQAVGARIVECANSVGGQEEAVDYVALIDNLVQSLSEAFTKQ